MKIALCFLLLCFADLILPSTYAQQGSSGRQRFLADKAKAEKGDAVAQYNVSVSFFAGKNVGEDKVEALKWLRKSADQKFTMAQHLLGDCHFMGRGTPPNYAEAVSWFQMAAEQNYAPSQARLGYCYSSGKGVSRNQAEAVRWCRKAAEQNFAASQSVLASYYSTGDGVPVDYVEAYAWHNLADEGGDRFAGKFRNDLEKKMSPQQVAAAEKRTKELRSQIAARLKSRGK